MAVHNRAVGGWDCVGNPKIKVPPPAQKITILPSTTDPYKPSLSNAGWPQPFQCICAPHRQPFLAFLYVRFKRSTYPVPAKYRNDSRMKVCHSLYTKLICSYFLRKFTMSLVLKRILKLFEQAHLRSFSAHGSVCRYFLSLSFELLSRTVWDFRPNR